MANSITKHIPNTITALNLISGCIAITFALNGALDIAGYCILLSAIFDFLDGLSARWLKAYSAIGKELDSLADVVSFGVAPSMILYHVLLQAQWPESIAPIAPYLPYCAFVMAAFSALRLAKFNLDERQTISFIGLNTPANAMFWLSLLGFETTVEILPLGLIALCFIFSGLLISEIEMFSFKSFSLDWRSHKLQYVVIFSGIVFVSSMGMAGLAPTIGLYITVSIIAKYIKR